MRSRAHCAAALFAALLPPATSGADFDVLIRGGRVLDGAGNPWYRADVGVKDGRIAAIGALADRSAERVIDAAGRFVCPGFIDLHTHSDEDLDRGDRNANLNYLTQGVTTVVTGNCGVSPIDLEAARARWHERGIGTNVVPLVGHGSVRDAVMGEEPREPTAEELEAMRALVRREMRAGAWGLSTGLEYVPGRYAATDEIVALARVAAAAGGVYESHMRNEAAEIVAAIEEAIRIGERAGLPVCVSHFKVTGKGNWGGMARAVAAIEAARSRGVEIIADQYPYPNSAPIGLLASFLEIPADLEPLASLSRAAADRDLDAGERQARRAAFVAALIDALGDADARARIREATEVGRPHVPSPVAMWGWHDFALLVSDRYPEFVGMNFIDIAAERKSDVFDAVCDLVAGDPDALYGGGSQSLDDLELALSQEWVAVSSDGGALPIWREGDPPVRGHPREAGSQTRALRKYVREERLLSWAQMVRKMTSLPASFLGLRDRGLVLEGFVADLVVFDPETVADRATWADSRRYCEGVEAVLVAGQVAIEDGAWNGGLFGRVLSRIEHGRDRRR